MFEDAVAPPYQTRPQEAISDEVVDYLNVRETVGHGEGEGEDDWACTLTHQLDEYKVGMEIRECSIEIGRVAPLLPVILPPVTQWRYARRGAVEILNASMAILISDLQMERVSPQARGM